MLDFDSSPILTAYEVRSVAGSKNPMTVEQKLTEDEALWKGLVAYDLPIDKERSVRRLAQLELHALGGEAHFSPDHGVFVSMTVLNKGIPQALEEYEIHESMHGITILQTSIAGLRAKPILRKEYQTQDRSPNSPLTPNQFLEDFSNPRERSRIMLNQAIVRGVRRSAGLPQ